MELNNIIFSCLLLLFGYIFNKYILKLFYNLKFNYLIDNDYKKPQAFHEKSTYRLGGVTFFLLLMLTFLYLFISKNILFFEYISFCTLFFLLGFIDDLKVKIAPKFRLIIMVGFLFFLVIHNQIYIEKTGLEFLNNLLEIDIFSLIFICLCFLFIINGCNLIDGFNGLLSIHSLVIFIILLGINFTNGNNDLAYVLFFIILINLLFIKFNFPKAQMFLGDSGAYLLGILVAISVIKTSILNPTISPFFFAVLLFYLFFEVFFSFFRKIFITRKSPLLPDNKHLHMIFYKFLLTTGKTKFNSNYLVSAYINLSYFFLIIPGVFFMSNGLFCRYYFFTLFFIYIYFYKFFRKKIKNKF